MSENAKKYLAWLSNHAYEKCDDGTDIDEVFFDHVNMLYEANIISLSDCKMLLHEFHLLYEELYSEE